MELRKKCLLSFFSIVTAFIVGLLVLQSSSKYVRLDLTEQGLFSLSEGTHNIIGQLNSPVKLTFFYSDKATADLVQFRAYAQRVKDLLQEYSNLGKDRIQLNIIDPEPFSEDEDLAVEFGLQGVPVQAGGEDAYFGLAAVSSDGNKAIIPFFQPSRESFLEYEITQLLYRVNRPNLPTLGVVTYLDVAGGYNMRTGQPTKSWMVFDQLESLFQIEYLDIDTLVNPPNVDVLLMVQPDQLPNQAIYAIDQFIVKGGHAVIFQDPYFEMGAMNPMSMRNTEAAWSLEPLYKHWGVDIPNQQAVVDKALAMVVSVGGNRPPMRHGGLISVEPDWMNTQDVAASNLEKVTFAASGYLKHSNEPKGVQQPSSLTFEPLITTSNQVGLKPITAFKGLKDPSVLYEELEASDQPFVLAARLFGTFTSSFERRPDPEKVSEEEGLDSGEADEGKEKEPIVYDEHVAEGTEAQVLLVADVDVLTDRMWVEVQEIFGQRVAAPWADNGAFVANALENMSGNTDLISIRSRGQYTRPFLVVEALQQRAEERFLENERRLREQLNETEAQLVALQGQQGEAESLVLTPEQKAALEAFQQEKVKIRKELREVRRELDKDIDELHQRLKLINISSMPIVVTILMLFTAFFRKRRRGMIQ